MIGISYLFVMSFIFLAFSCENDAKLIVVDATVDILVLDPRANNILEMDNFKEENIKIYYLVNGKKELFNRPNLDYPKGYAILKNQKEQLILRVFLNSDLEAPFTFIDYGDSDIDTIKSEFHRNGQSVISIKIWYNDQLKWESGNEDFSELRTFSITKTL
ncbi:hypothetical protein ACFQRK_12590 [Parapedobacter sp. GCM10030251]|uniref:hypothetical protein n=1 Tax=Parapedobacter sp. GCM10030251 TaxID=3273419 RepID=UPI00361FC711